MEGWEQKSLGEVIRLEYGKPLAPEDRHPAGLYPAYGANGEKDRTDKFYCERPSIVVGRKGSAGEITLTEDKFWPLDVTYFVDFDRRRYDLRFLYYLLTTLDLPQLAKGVKPGINRNEVHALQVRVPSLPEQRRIVAILDEAFEAIATAKASTARTAILSAESHAAARSAAFSAIAADAPRVRLASVVDRLTNGYVGPVRGVYVDKGVPYLLARHVKNNRLKFDGKTFVTDAFNLKHKKSILKTGDLLLVQSGHIGHCAVVGPEHAGHNCHAMIVITPRPGVLLGRYLAEFFYTDEMLRKVESIRSGSTVPHLTCGQVREIAVPVPAIGIQLQMIEQMSDIAEACCGLADSLARKLAALDELKRSLLQQAFTGELTAKSTDQQVAQVA